MAARRPACCTGSRCPGWPAGSAATRAGLRLDSGVVDRLDGGRALRLDAGQAGRLGADPGRGGPGAGRRAGPGRAARGGHQPGPAGPGAAQPGVRRRRRWTPGSWTGTPRSSRRCCRPTSSRSRRWPPRWPAPRRAGRRPGARRPPVGLAQRAGRPPGRPVRRTAPATRSRSATGWTGRRARRLVHRSTDAAHRPTGVARALVTAAADRVVLDVDGVRRVFRVHRAGSVVFVDGPDGAASLTELPRFPLPRAALAAGRCSRRCPAR